MDGCLGGVLRGVCAGKYLEHAFRLAFNLSEAVFDERTEHIVDVFGVGAETRSNSLLCDAWLFISHKHMYLVNRKNFNLRSRRR